MSGIRNPEVNTLCPKTRYSRDLCKHVPTLGYNCTLLKESKTDFAVIPHWSVLLIDTSKYRWRSKNSSRQTLARPVNPSHQGHGERSITPPVPSEALVPQAVALAAGVALRCIVPRVGDLHSWIQAIRSTKSRAPIAKWKKHIIFWRLKVFSKSQTYQHYLIPVTTR